MHHPRSHSLSDRDWRLGYLKGYEQEPPASAFDVEHIDRWIPARVPGNVRDDLMRAGLLPDLYYGDACRQHDWVNDCLWWYETVVERERRPGERLILDFRGIDYRSVVFWNRTRLGSNEGMFSRLLYDVTDLTKEVNALHVRIAGSRYLPRPELSRAQSLWQPVASRLQGMRAFPERFGTMKCQMSYGWDFAPDMRAMGIWDDVYLHTCGPVFVERVALSAQLSDDYSTAELTARITLDCARAGDYLLELTVEGETCDAPAETFRFQVYLPAGRDTLERRVTIPHPHLWYPWERGAQALYRVTVRVLAGDTVADELHERFAFRDVRLDRNPDTPLAVPDWTFRINGEPLFVRGANWVPADCLPGRLRDDDYTELLGLARDANINMLRVWGGGLREKQAFYDRCAELGLLVWQEFPFACAFLDRFQRNDDFVALVRKEVTAIVRRLHNAPAVVVYCGGNEFSPRRNAPLVDVMRDTVGAEDPARLFFAASPRGGEAHDWRVWHHFANPCAFEDDRSQFVSEFGLQSLPGRDSFKQFLPDEAAWPPGPLWEVHGAQLEKLERYAKAMHEYTDLPGMIDASQRAQAHALQIAIEHARRRKFACSGIMFWQFNEPWPAISWSVLDYFRRPKLAYHTIKRCYAPVLATVRYPRRRYQAGEQVPLEVWVINDTLRDLTDCRIELYMLAEEGRAFNIAFTVDEVPANTAGHAFEFDLVLPERDDLTLHVDVSHNGDILSSNQYDLSLYDDVEPPPVQGVMQRFTNTLLS